MVAIPLRSARAVHTAAAAWGANPTTTRRVVLEKSDHGYRWKLTEAPIPPVGEHQVLIRVRAVALNRGDLEILDSNGGPDISGRVVASDAAGDVVAVGKRVSRFRPALASPARTSRTGPMDRPTQEKLSKALGASVDGVLAEFVVLDDTNVAPAPAGLSYEEASTLPTAGLTGWMASVGRREPHRGDVVLIQGTGGVSIFAMQFAAASGARIILTSSSDAKLARAQAIAAHVGINYRSVPEWSKQVLQVTYGHGADVVVDVGGKSTLEQSVRSLAYGRDTLHSRRTDRLRWCDPRGRAARQGRERPWHLRRLARGLSAHERVHRRASPAPGDRQDFSLRAIRRGASSTWPQTPSSARSCWRSPPLKEFASGRARLTAQ